MTVIEKQYMESVININRMMRKAQEVGIDWEQRRYEIAKDVSTYVFGLTLSQTIENRPTYKEVAESSVKMADALIEELKKTTETK